MRATLPILLAGLLLACPAADPADPAGRATEGSRVEVRAALVPAPAGDAAAVYLVLQNAGDAGDRLLGAASSEAARVMLHRSRHEGGRARMEPLEEGIPLPAGGHALLAPGGAHVMLMGLARAPAAGDELALVLRFERAGEVPVRARVVDPGELESRFEAALPAGARP